MGKLLFFKDRQSGRQVEIADDFNRALALIVKLANSLPDEESQPTHGIIPQSSLELWLRKRISRKIMELGALSTPVFICGLYIAEILGKADADMQKYAVDFFERWSRSQNPFELKEGGDFCFILCGAFPRRCNRRTMKTRDYQSFGRGFYQRFYASTGKPIGHYMSTNFLLMQEIANSVLAAKHSK